MASMGRGRVLVFTLIACIPFLPQKSNSAVIPAAAVDCSTLIYDLAACVLFLESGSTVGFPTSSCCDGLATIVNTNSTCMCKVLATSTAMGIIFNMTRATGLPFFCHISDTQAFNCNGRPPAASASPDDGPSPRPPYPPPGPVESAADSSSYSIGKTHIFGVLYIISMAILFKL